MNLVRDCMTTPAVTIRTSTTVAEIVRTFDRGVMTALPVLDGDDGRQLDIVAWRLVAAQAHRVIVIENDRPVGVLSVDDVLGGLMYRVVTAPLRSIMSHPVKSVMLGAPISKAIELLSSAGVHGLVVVDGLAAVGVFGHQEALASRRLPPPLLADPVEEVMSQELVTLDASIPLHRAARYAWTTKSRRVLVKEDGKLVGIVSDLDLVEALTRAVGAVAVS